MNFDSVSKDVENLISLADSPKNLPLVIFNNMVKNDYYLEGVLPSLRKEATFIRENKDSYNECKITAVVLKNYQNKEKILTSKNIAISVLQNLDKLDVFD